jgi:ribose 5-phosphate isomerase B
MKRKEAIVIGSDHGGFTLKKKIKEYLKKKGFSVVDVGAYTDQRCDYPLFAAQVAKKVSQGKPRRGILVCKSGIGNAIVANKFPGVRAALCYSGKAARLSREHNDANILSLGSLFTNERLTKRIIDIWLKTKFQGGRHSRRLRMIRAIERGS